MPKAPRGARAGQWGGASPAANQRSPRPSRLSSRHPAERGWSSSGFALETVPGEAQALPGPVSCVPGRVQAPPDGSHGEDGAGQPWRRSAPPDREVEPSAHMPTLPNPSPKGAGLPREREGVPAPLTGHLRPRVCWWRSPGGHSVALGAASKGVTAPPQGNENGVWSLSSLLAQSS